MVSYFNVRPYEGIYFHILIYSYGEMATNITVVLLYIDGDNFRLHIFLRQEKTDL